MKFKKILIADPRPLAREGIKQILRTRDTGFVFIEAGNDGQFIRATRHAERFDLILIHTDFLSNGKRGYINAYLYQTENRMMLICDTLSEDLRLKLKFFRFAGVIKNSDSVETVESRIFELITTHYCCPSQDSCATKPVGSQSTNASRRQKLKQLTEKQETVVSYLKAGLMNKEIAFEMGIQESTVKRHVYDIFKKLQINSRTQLVLMLGGI